MTKAPFDAAPFFDVIGKCSVHHQHRNNRCFNHRLGNTAEYSFAKTTMSVRPHHDQIGGGIDGMLD